MWSLRLLNSHRFISLNTYVAMLELVTVLPVYREETHQIIFLFLAYCCSISSFWGWEFCFWSWNNFTVYIVRIWLLNVRLLSISYVCFTQLWHLLVLWFMQHDEGRYSWLWWGFLVSGNRYRIFADYLGQLLIFVASLCLMCKNRWWDMQ